MALPTMSAVISSLTSLVQYFIHLIPRAFIFLSYLCKFLQRREQKPEQLISLTESLHRSQVVSPRAIPDLEKWNDFFEVAASSDDTTFSYDIWKRIIGAFYDSSPLPPNYWIFEDTPLRIPYLV